MQLQRQNAICLNLSDAGHEKGTKTVNVKSVNPNVKSIKHMAFAVCDAKKALGAYAQFLHVPAKTEITHFAKSGNKVALFYLGGIEYQLCESTVENGRFAAWIKERGAEGLHHICYEVDDIIAARDKLIAAGARVLGDGEPRIGAHNKPVLFLHPKDFVGTLVEIEQV